MAAIRDGSGIRQNFIGWCKRNVNSAIVIGSIGLIFSGIQTCNVISTPTTNNAQNQNSLGIVVDAQTLESLLNESRLKGERSGTMYIIVSRLNDSTSR